MVAEAVASGLGTLAKLTTLTQRTVLLVSESVLPEEIEEQAMDLASFKQFCDLDQVFFLQPLVKK